MRATALMFAAALLLLGQPLAAQTPEAPAKGQKSPEMRGRVGSVSPDEARRAERARKRAAAAHKPAPAKAVPVETPQPAVEKKRAVPPPEPPREAAAPRREPRDEKPVKEARPRETPDAVPAHTAGVPHRHRHNVAERPRPERVVRVKRPRYAKVRPSDDRPVRTRRIYAGVPQRWTPRVGGTVPRGVRLYALPPGYYAPGPGYVYGAAEVPQRRWWYAPQPVYAAPAMPYYEEPYGE